MSQIVDEHGVEGLRDLWLAVPRDASAEEVRAAYEALFDQPIDVLIEPRTMEVLGMQVEQQRRSCYFALCLGEPRPWDGDDWAAPAPDGCENDPRAIGPRFPIMTDLDGPSAWREYVLDFGVASNTVTTSEGVEAVDLSCGELLCDRGYSHRTFSPGVDEFHFLFEPGRHAVQIRTALDDLPADTPGELSLHRGTQ